MNNPSLKPAIRIFENLFSKMNDRFFDGCLVVPVIVISPEGKSNINGWCTSWKAWKSTSEKGRAENIGDDDGYYEINLSAEYLNDPINVIIGTLLHEMVHLYDLQEGIKDTSRSGYYHNKSFKKSAEAHGLITEKVEGSGYSKTELSPEALDFVKTLEDVRFDLFRTVNNTETEKSVKTTVHRYVCPSCGNIVRATKIVRVGCLDCNKQMLEQEDKTENLKEILLNEK